MAHQRLAGLGLMALFLVSMIAPAYAETYYAHDNTTVKFFEEIHYAYSGHGHSVNLTLLKEGFAMDCLNAQGVNYCSTGIDYFMDPTTLITNQGRGISQCLRFGSTTTDTCTAANFIKYIGWSTSTAVAANGDTYAGGAGVACSSTNLIVDANGLRDVAGTITPAANGVTIVTTIAKTFSITATYSAVDAACLLSGTGTNADSGTNPLIYAEASQIGPNTFNNGDSLTGTFQITTS